jgi:hypothetical protein
MTEPTVKTKRSRYRFVAGAAAATGRSAFAGDAKNLPPGASERTCDLGSGARAHGRPPKHEKNITRYAASRLPAAPESSASFALLHSRDGIIPPNGLVTAVKTAPEDPAHAAKPTRRDRNYQHQARGRLGNDKKNAWNA